MKPVVRVSLCLALWLLFALATSRVASGPRCADTMPAASAYDAPHRCAP